MPYVTYGNRPLSNRVDSDSKAIRKQWEPEEKVRWERALVVVTFLGEAW